MAEDTRELYKLIGNYEATSKRIFDELRNFNEGAKKNEEDHRVIKDELSKVAEKCMSQDVRITAIEKTGVTKPTMMKIDGSLLLVALNWAKDILQWLGLLKVG